MLRSIPPRAHTHLTYDRKGKYTRARTEGAHARISLHHPVGDVHHVVVELQHLLECAGLLELSALRRADAGALPAPAATATIATHATTTATAACLSAEADKRVCADGATSSASTGAFIHVQNKTL